MSPARDLYDLTRELNRAQATIERCERELRAVTFETPLSRVVRLKDELVEARKARDACDAKLTALARWPWPITRSF